MEIRKAILNDVPEIVPLMQQLGYPTTVEQFNHRFNAIAENPCYHTLVVELDGKIIGMAGLCTGLFYEYDGTYVRIVTFVVDTNYRRKGIGKKLLQEAESWAKKQGAIGISLNSGNRSERKDAHQFYISMGYEAKSLGFSKSLI